MNPRLRATLPQKAPLASTSLPSRLLQRKCACGGAPGPTGECEACRQKKLQRRLGNSPSLSITFGYDFSGVPVQTKLGLSSPEDACEKEAERVAGEVAALSSALGGAEELRPSLLSRLSVPRVMGLSGVSPRSFQSTTNSGRKLSVSAYRDDEPAAEPRIVPPGIESRILQSRGRGQAVPAHVQNAMALRTGYDFKAVRVKTDSESAELSRSLNARAFTLGSDIWLGRDESPDDIRLMAHELTHVVQQGAVRPMGAVSPAGLENLAQRSTVMGYLQALTRGMSHEASLYSKEIERFEAGNSADQVAKLQRALLERPTGGEVDRSSNSKVMRDCGCSGPAPGGGGAAAPCAVPTNFRETARSKAANGVLHFEYAWDSSTGNLADLSACEVGEHVAYPDGFTAPPFVEWQNPTIIWIAGTRGGFDDNHNLNATTPYSNASLKAVQHYRYHCPCKDSDKPVNLVGPVAINRKISQKPDGKYKYEITKNGLSNEVDPLP